MSTPPHPIWRNSYRALSPILYRLVKLIAVLDSKLEKTILLRSAENWQNLPTNQYVFHCASVGEFEAARPIIEALMQHGYTPIVAMGSPSLESRRNSYPNTGLFWCWSPLDIPKSVSAFLKMVQPKAIIITKHDIWPELVWQSYEKNIPVLLQSANFRPDSKRNLAIIHSFQKSLFGALVGVGAISEEDAERFRVLLKNRTIVKVTGDTRYDRVLQNANQPDKRPEKLIEWIKKKPTIILGSSWKADEEWLINGLKSIIGKLDFHLIIVPHETDEEIIRASVQRLEMNGYLVKRYTEGIDEIHRYNALVVDVQGLLATLYRDTKIAWIGGGFGQGVHSVLEPAVFGVPVFFGPNHLMSREARLLVERKGGFVVSENTNWKENLYLLLTHQEFYEETSNQCKKIVLQSAGATQKVLDWIYSL